MIRGTELCARPNRRPARSRRRPSTFLVSRSTSTTSAGFKASIRCKKASLARFASAIRDRSTLEGEGHSASTTFPLTWAESSAAKAFASRASTLMVGVGGRSSERSRLPEAWSTSIEMRLAVELPLHRQSSRGREPGISSRLSGRNRRCRSARGLRGGTGRRCIRRRGRVLSRAFRALRAGPTRGTKGARGASRPRCDRGSPSRWPPARAERPYAVGSSARDVGCRLAATSRMIPSRIELCIRVSPFDHGCGRVVNNEPYNRTSPLPPKGSRQRDERLPAIASDFARDCCGCRSSLNTGTNETIPLLYLNHSASAHQLTA